MRHIVPKEFSKRGRKNGNVSQHPMGLILTTSVVVSLSPFQMPFFTDDSTSQLIAYLYISKIAQISIKRNVVLSMACR